MIIYKACAICGESCISENFVKTRDGEPLYWFKLPNPKDPMNETVIFCSPQHCLDWYQRNLDSVDKNK